MGRPTLMRPSVLPSRWASPESVGGWDQWGTGFLLICSVGAKGRAPSLLSAENLIQFPSYPPPKEATSSTIPWGVLLGCKMNSFPSSTQHRQESLLLQRYWVPQSPTTSEVSSWGPRVQHRSLWGTFHTQTQVTSISPRSMWLREVGSGKPSGTLLLPLWHQWDGRKVGLSDTTGVLRQNE